MALSNILLSDLKSGRCSNTAEVRLLRFWEARNVRKGGELMSVDMLFVDANATVTQGSVAANRQLRFRDRLTEDIIGEVNAIRSTITDRIPGAQRVMLTLRLESGENVCVSMFDSMALAFHTKFDSYKKEPRIVVATSINPKIVGGRLFLNATSGTHLYFDPETAASKEMFDTLPGEGTDAGSGSSKVVHAQKEPQTMSMQKQPHSRLKILPQDIQTDIISRVAKSSRKEVRRIMEASPRLAIAAAQPQVYKNINLRPLTIHPLASLRRYKDLMDLCLAAGNLEAHYIRGIQEYFH